MAGVNIRSRKPARSVPEFFARSDARGSVEDSEPRPGAGCALGGPLGGAGSGGSGYFMTNSGDRPQRLSDHFSILPGSARRHHRFPKLQAITLSYNRTSGRHGFRKRRRVDGCSSTPGSSGTLPQPGLGARWGPAQPAREECAVAREQSAPARRYVHPPRCRTLYSAALPKTTGGPRHKQGEQRRSGPRSASSFLSAVRPGAAAKVRDPVPADAIASASEGGSVPGFFVPSCRACASRFGRVRTGSRSQREGGPQFGRVLPGVA